MTRDALKVNTTRDFATVQLSNRYCVIKCMSQQKEVSQGERPVSAQSL